MQYEKNTKHTEINTNESTHSEMSPVWQNPIQGTVRSAHLSLFMTVHNFSTQYNRKQFWYPDKHHSWEVVYRRRGGTHFKTVSSWLYAKSAATENTLVPVFCLTVCMTKLTLLDDQKNE